MASGAKSKRGLIRALPEPPERLEIVEGGRAVEGEVVQGEDHLCAVYLRFNAEDESRTVTVPCTKLGGHVDLYHAYERFQEGYPIPEIEIRWLSRQPDQDDLAHELASRRRRAG